MFSRFFSKINVRNYLKPEMVPGLSQFLDFRSFSSVFTDITMILFFYNLAALGLVEDDHQSFAWAVAMIAAAYVLVHGAKKQAGTGGSTALACLQGSLSVLSFRSAVRQFSNVCWNVEEIEDDVCYYVEGIQENVENLVYSIVSPIWRSIHWPTFFMTLVLLLFLRLSTSRNSLPQHTQNTLPQFGKVRFVYGESTEETRLRDELARTQALLDQTLESHADLQQKTDSKQEECEEALRRWERSCVELTERNAGLRQQIKAQSHESEALRAEFQSQVDEAKREAVHEHTKVGKLLGRAHRDIAQLKRQLDDARFSQKIAVQTEEKKQESKLQKTISALHAKLEKSNNENAELQRERRQLQEENSMLQKTVNKKDQVHRAFRNTTEEVERLKDLLMAEKEKSLIEEKASHDLRTLLNEKDTQLSDMKEQFSLEKEKTSAELVEKSEKLEQAECRLKLSEINVERLNNIVATEKQQATAELEQLMGLLQQKDDEIKSLTRRLTSEKLTASTKLAEKEEELERMYALKARIQDTEEEQREECVKQLTAQDATPTPTIPGCGCCFRLDRPATSSKRIDASDTSDTPGPDGNTGNEPSNNDEGGNDKTSNDEAGTDVGSNDKSGDAESGNVVSNDENADDEPDNNQTGTGETGTDETGQEETENDKAVNEEPLNDERRNSNIGNSKTCYDKTSTDETNKNGADDDQIAPGESTGNVSAGTDNAADNVQPDDSEKSGSENDPNSKGVSDETMKQPAGPDTEQGVEDRNIDGGAAIATPDNSHEPAPVLQNITGTTSDSATKKSPNAVVEEEPANNEVGGDGARASVVEHDSNHKSDAGPRVGAEEIPSATTEKSSTPLAGQETTDSKVGSSESSPTQSSDKQESIPALRLGAEEVKYHTTEIPSTPTASQYATDNELGREEAVNGKPRDDVIPASSTQPDVADTFNGTTQKPFNSLTSEQTPASEVSGAGPSNGEPSANQMPVSSNDTNTGVLPSRWAGPPATSSAFPVGDTDMTDVDSSATEPEQADEDIPDAAPPPVQPQSQDLDELPDTHDEQLQGDDLDGDYEMEGAAPEQVIPPQAPAVAGDVDMGGSTIRRLGKTTNIGKEQPIFTDVPKGVTIPGLFASAIQSRTRATQRRGAPKSNAVRRTGPTGSIIKGEGPTIIKIQGSPRRFDSAIGTVTEQFAVPISGHPQTGSGFHAASFAFTPQNGAPAMQFPPAGGPHESQTDTTIPGPAPQNGTPTSQSPFTSGPQNSQADASNAVTAPQQASDHGDDVEQHEATFEEAEAMARHEIAQAETTGTVADLFNTWAKGLEDNLKKGEYSPAELNVYFSYAFMKWDCFTLSTLERIVRSANFVYTFFVRSLLNGSELAASQQTDEGVRGALRAMKVVADRGSENLFEYRNNSNINPYYLFMDEPGRVTDRVKRSIRDARAAEAGSNLIRFRNWHEALQTFPNEAVAALRTYVKEMVDRIDHDMYRDDDERDQILWLAQDIDGIAHPATGWIDPHRFRTNLFPDVGEGAVSEAKRKRR